MSGRIAVIVTALVIVVLLFSTMACVEEGGLLDTQPLPPVFQTARADKLTQ